MSAEEEKKVSNTKLVVIDTKTLVAKSFEGNFPCGEAHLPNPNGEDEYTAVEITEQLNDFLKAADGARYRAIAEADKKAAIGKKLVELTNEYEGWFDRLGPRRRIRFDSFGF